ncbi:MAG: glycosyltransferase [Acidobacteria bacterium]|nr:glycosyltransferase [Acidobacteriota bacterium]NIM61150.1 glycosyltransferase [Acidobacteriota bacterium]NIO58025.1 glycosyltransferase [Acidobacteriota bacterium]NIQ29032.1 glycosyltransferase [Acidobacteriota bacterium]NIQ83558.1 glycosyltransferase [Acidobacteriota bacterium]
MKVAFVEPHLGLFGGIRRILELANRLTDRGVETTVFHPEGTPCEWMECRARVRPSARLLEESQDVVIYNDPNPEDFGLVRRAPARLRVFYVLELYETSLLPGFHPMIYRPRHQRTLYMKRSLKAGYLLLTNATWLTTFLSDRLGLESTLLLGGVNREMFHPVKREPNDGFRVLCSGDPRPRKGTDDIRAAVELARRSCPEIRLDTYHGRGVPQHEMARVYGAADLFVEASHQAGWNNPAAEAMACGVPLVCTDIGGVRDFAVHERTALLAPPGDVPAIAAAIVRMVQDDALRGRLVAAGLESIDRFDWDRSADRLIEILERSLAREAAHA